MNILSQFIVILHLFVIIMGVFLAISGQFVVFLFGVLHSLGVGSLCGRVSFPVPHLASRSPFSMESQFIALF